MTVTTAASLDAYLTDAAAARPGHPAVVDPSGRCLTYGELDHHAGRVAALLRERGIGPGARVALMTGRRCETVALLFGILRAGAAYVPVDPGGGGARIRRILEDCRPALLFHDEAGAGRLRPHPADAGGASGELPAMGGPGSTGGALRWTRDPVGAPGAPAVSDGERLAYLLYTSGSTGVPKGVRLTHANARAFTEWAAHRFALGPDDRVAGFAPLHFDLSVFDVFATVRAGATLYQVPEAVTADPRAVPGFLHRHGITVWYSTPSVLRPAADAAGPVPSALRLVLFAGEVFPVPALRRLTRVWPAPDYYNLYGPTETNVCAFAPVPLPVPDERTDPYPIGHACPHCRIMLVDEENRPVPEGRPGLLCVSGPSVFPGYWNSPEDPGFVHDGRRWYNTGDVARPTAEGLVFCGRRDRMVKRSGHRIELDEIETALARCPGVRDVAVVADPGEASAVITAFVVASGDRLDQIALRRFCRHELGPHLVPDRFRRVDRLPLTSTGKTDYQGLATRRSGGEERP